MYLVGNDDDAPLITEVCKACKSLPVPDYSCRVVGIGQYEHLASVVSHLGKVVEVHGI